MIRKKMIYLSIMVLLGICISKKSYAVTKPTYYGYVAEKRKDQNLTEGELISIAEEEMASRQMYSEFEKDIKNTKNSISDIYGRYHVSYTGALNYSLSNFLLQAYSLRDLSPSEGMQPIAGANRDAKFFKIIGFDNRWINKSEGLSSLETIRWILYQFDLDKVLSSYSADNKEVLSELYHGIPEKIIKEDKYKDFVIKLPKQTNLLSRGDVLVYYDERSNSIKSYGIYVGKDAHNMPYALSAGKMVTHPKSIKRRYENGIWALSYINSTDVYMQDVEGYPNLISGTKYNYAIKMKLK